MRQKVKLSIKREIAVQKKEHPGLPVKYVRLISKQHIALKNKGKRSVG